MILLMPRLPGPAAERLLDGMLKDDGLRWSSFEPETHPDGVRFAPTGGTTVSAARLREIREALVAVGRANGYPDSGRAQYAGFDAALADWISGHAEFHSGEALRDDVWSYIGVVMAPDIVHWRFRSARERYVGGVRNTFQRVWLRARALDRGEGSDERWGLLASLTEDALVAITERPVIGADPTLARALAEGWVRAAARLGQRRMEPVMRLATIRLRIRNEIQSLSTLPSAELAATMDEFFVAAAAALGTEHVESTIVSEATVADTESGLMLPASPLPRRSRFAIWRSRS